MSHELQNIPFYWTALAHWMTCAVLAFQYPKRLGPWQTGLLLSGFFLLLQGFMFVTAPQNGMVFNLLMLCFAGLTLFQLWVLGPLTLRQAVYYGARLFIISGFMASLSWQLYIYYAQRWSLLSHLPAQIVFMLCFFLLICGIMLLVEYPHRKVNPELPISRTTCVSTVVLALMIYILSSLSFTRFETPFGASTYAEAFNVRSLAYFGGVAMLYAGHLQLCESYVTRERDALEGMLSMQYRSYQLGQESVELVNRKYHDLKHQIQALRSGIGAEQKLELLDKLEQEIQIYEAQNKTGNQILDTILTSKSIHCQQSGISLTCVADGKLLDFMDIADISVLFGNALDNAIEAAGQIPEAEQRLIDLSVREHKGFLRIRVRNRYAGNIKMRNGIPVTTKGDTRNHGYGIKSITATAEKYGGSVTLEARDGWFELRVLIPRST